MHEYVKKILNTSLHHKYKRSDEPACIAQSCTVCPDVRSRSPEGTESDPGTAPFTPTLIGTGRHHWCKMHQDIIYIYIILIIIYIIYIYMYVYIYTKMHRSEFTCEVILTMKHVYNTLSTVAVTPLCVWRLPGRKRPPCRPAITPHHDLATVTLLCKFLRCSKSVQRFIDVETSNTDQINLQINKVFSLKEIGAAAPRQVPSSCLRAAWVTWKRTVTE